jgi:hypothetical protein
MGKSGSGDNVTFEVPAAVVIPWQRRRKAAAPLKAQNYTFMGQMRLKYEDGTVEGVVLYMPFGTIQQGEEYRKADLHELRDYLKSKCREIDRFLQ